MQPPDAAPSRHFHIVAPNPEAALKLGFEKSIELALAEGHRDLNLAVPAKGNLDGLISELLGDKPTRTLQRDNALKLGKLTLRLATQRVPVRFEGPVLAAWINADHLTSIARSHFATAIVFLPWCDEERLAFEELFPSALPYSGDVRVQDSGANDGTK